MRPEDLRQGRPDAGLYSSAWHCSSCFSTMADPKNKIISFSHRGYNRPYFLNGDLLLQKVRRGWDLFEGKGEFYDRMDDNADTLMYLHKEENRQKFAYIRDRHSRKANFQDIGGVRV